MPGSLGAWSLVVRSAFGALAGGVLGGGLGLVVGWLLGAALSIWGMVSVPILGALGVLLGGIGGAAYPWLRRSYEAA